MDPVWEGFVIKGTGDGNFFDIKDLDGLVMYLGRFEVGTELECVFRKKRKKATLRQNRYYWPVILGMIADYTGHTPEEIHSTLTAKFLKKRSDTGIEVIPSTMDLSTTEREKYHEDCRRWAKVVFNLDIPLPHKVDTGDNDDGEEDEDSGVNSD